MKVYLNVKGGNLSVWVAGSPGKGKSNLLRELARQLRKDIFVVVIEPTKSTFCSVPF